LFVVVAFGTRHTLASYVSMHAVPDTTASTGHFFNGASGGSPIAAALAPSTSPAASMIPRTTRRMIGLLSLGSPAGIHIAAPQHRPGPAPPARRTTVARL
jgi:hypothetical protein